MIQQRTPKKIKGARKKQSAQRKAEAARRKAISDAEIIEYRGTYYIPQHRKIRRRLLTRTSNFIYFYSYLHNLILFDLVGLVWRYAE